MRSPLAALPYARPRRAGVALFSLALAAAIPVSALAQDARSWLDGRLTIGGEAVVNLSPPDDGFFNYTDYSDDALRLFVGTLAGEFRLGDRAAILAEARVQNASVQASAWYLRLRPSKDLPLDVQVGRIPPVFGSYARKRYGADNPLIGLPLAYQYLTTIRADSIPGSADALLATRGRGWLVRYPVAEGSTEAGAGLPFASATRWDAGAQARWSAGGLEAALAVTQGSLSAPRVRDNNRGKQLAGRVTWRPPPALMIGGSGARGAFIDSDVTDALAPEYSREGYVQEALAFDAEVSWGYWLVRGEILRGRWRVPPLGSPAIVSPLGSTAAYVEGRYRLRPGLSLAARLDRLTFSRIEGLLFGGQPTSWDADVSRVEAGVAWNPFRYGTVKVVGQYNERDSDRPRRRETLIATQLAVWF